MDTTTLSQVKDELYKRDHPTLTSIDVEAHAETVYEILELKKKHNVLMLGHNYMEPLVFGLSSSNEQGDSLALSIYAAEADNEYIIFNGVPFMAETAKVLNPKKHVFVADKSAGCSLADNFTAEDVRQIKQKYPGVPVMVYINSYADVKSECDVCCTSANAKDIALSMPGDQLIFVPDIYFAKNLESELDGQKKLIYPGKDNDVRGSICEVHEEFRLDDLLSVRKAFDIPKGHSERVLYAHWECRPEVLNEADFYGSTGQIRNDIAARVSMGILERAFIASECELTANLSQEFPTVSFWTACSVRCSHMAKVTLQGILDTLRAIDNHEDLSSHEITLSPQIIEDARKSIEKMVELSRQSSR